MAQQFGAFFTAVLMRAAGGGRLGRGEPSLKRNQCFAMLFERGIQFSDLPLGLNFSRRELLQFDNDAGQLLVASC